MFNPWACILCNSSQFTKHIGWTPASFHFGRTSNFDPKVTFTSFQPWEAESLFGLAKGVCFSGLFPFNIRTKQIQTEEEEKIV